MDPYRSLRRAASFAALGFLLVGPLAVQAQEATLRVIRSWVDDVKLDDGSLARWTFTVTYDAATGAYARTATDATGAVVLREPLPASLVAPNEDEIALARRIILADTELAALHARAANPQLEGGFVLLQEEGAACGPGSRCLQFDMYNVDHAARRVDRIRYVVVDLRTGTLVSRDFDPSRGQDRSTPR